MKYLDLLKGYKTKVAGLGLLLIAVSFVLEERYEEALAKALEGLGLIGIAFKLERS